MHKGHCLCEKVKFDISSTMESAVACHCEQCRRWTGHFLAGVEVPRDALTIYGEEHLKWFYSSEKVRRGFCSYCGSTLFFDPLDQARHSWISVSMGTLDLPTHTRLGQHIFTAEKGDYYEITDGLPQNEY